MIIKSPEMKCVARSTSLKQSRKFTLNVSQRCRFNFARGGALIAAVALFSLAAIATSSAFSGGAFVGIIMRRPDPQPNPGSMRKLTGNKLAAVPGKSILRDSDDSILGLAELNIERRGHTATELADGKILIVGGENKDGLVRRSESFEPDSQSFVFSARLRMARSDHTTTRLADGRVLVIGGRNRAGLESTEFFDPATGSFEYGPALNRARAGHSATVLEDGRVLIVGGDDEGTAEIFDPGKQTFSLLDERLPASRAFHSAVLLRNGKVLIAGGLAQDKTALRDGQLFDPRTLSFAVTRNSMRGARKRPTLRVLPDGKVQVIGGDAERSMEMFNADEEYFTAHAHLLPGSNHIEEILRAQTRAGLFGEGTPEILRRSPSFLPAIEEMLDRSEYSLTDLPGTGKAVIAGGRKSGETLKSVVILSSSTATVTTDKTDYAPGETVVISGSGWQAEETVTLTLHRDNATEDTVLESVVDADGNFKNSEYLIQESDRDLAFLLTAVGQTSGYTAQTSFTDAGPTNPPAQAIPYIQDFFTLPHTGSGSSNYPAGWQGWTLATASSTSFRTTSPVADETLIAGSSASTNVGGVHNYNGKVGMLGTGSSGTDPSVCLAINTTAASNIMVSFDIMTIRNPYNGGTNTRINQVDLQYRVGTIGSFISVSGNANGIYENNMTTQTGSGVTTPQNSQIKTFTLAGACENQSNVQLRWVQRDQPSQAGARPSFAVDNISICALPGAANAITGTAAVCQGQSGVSYSIPAIAAAASYSWAYSGTGATVNGTTNSITIDFSGTATSGNLTVKGVNPCGDGAVSANFAISVSPNANAGTVSGTSPLCIGATTTYSSNGDAGGSWSSTNPAVASVNSSTGLVTALTAGTTDITYTVTTGCNTPKSSFKTLTVNPDANAGTVSGTSPLCIGATTTYSSNGDAGGSWSSTNPAVATVNPATGSVTAVSAGTTDITYTVTAGCNAPKSSFKTLTVDPISVGGTASAATSAFCGSGSTTITLSGQTGSIVKWQYSTNAGSSWNDIASASNPLSTPPLTVTTQFRALVKSGVCSASYSGPAEVTIYARPVETILSGPASQSIQYSDSIAPVVISASDADSPGSSLGAAASWNKNGGPFTSGLPSGLNFALLSTTEGPPGSRTWTLSGYALVEPAAYVVRIGVTDGLSCSSYRDVALNVTQEDSAATYIGTTFASTSSATSSTAIIALAATIKDITAVDPNASPPGPDSYAGDIRNAKVDFYVDSFLACSNLPVGLADPSDRKVGTVTCSYNADIGTANSKSFTVRIVVKGYYTGDVNDGVITVSRPLNDFITGGGFATPTMSSGQYAADPGTKVNFGFSVKYNKSGKNLQGGANIIVRSGGRVYQVKSNAVDSLSVDKATGKAQFNAKANIQDVTDPLNPIAISGNATLILSMTDRGEPGSSDSIALTLLNSSGGLYFSSKWDGTKSIENMLQGGNLVVH